MKFRRYIQLACGLAFASLCLSVFASPLDLFLLRKLPDFSSIADTQSRKEAFFKYVLPQIEEANGEVWAQRRRLQHLKHHFNHGYLNRRDAHWLRHMAERYGMPIDSDAALESSHIDRLLLRVDVIPPSMAMAQAALESGWGTSRFAQDGNNLFGMWCYTPGCGLVPRNRPAGATHEVTKYLTPKDSFADYIANLNSNAAYKDLRRIRQQVRATGDPLDGMMIADGLYRYSGEGWGYVDKIQRFIRSNDLTIYDESSVY